MTFEEYLKRRKELTTAYDKVLVKFQQANTPGASLSAEHELIRLDELIQALDKAWQEANEHSG